MNLFWKILTGLKWANRARSLARQRAITRAEQGDANAQYDLGERFHDGLGLPCDHQQAFTWFLRAAQQGHPRAQTNVGLMLFVGRGTKSDLVEAVKWLTLAAGQRDHKATEIVEQVRSRMDPDQFAQGQIRAQEHRQPSER